MTLRVSHCCCGSSLRSGTKIIAVYLRVSSICASKLSVATFYREILHRAQPLLADLMFLWTWSLTLREERRLRVFKNSVLRRIIGPKRDDVTGRWENYIMSVLTHCIPHPIFCGWQKSRRMRWEGHVARIEVVRGDVWGKRSMGRPRSRWKTMLRWLFGKSDVWLWTESSWLRIGTGGGHLWMW